MDIKNLKIELDENSYNILIGSNFLQGNLLKDFVENKILARSADKTLTIFYFISARSAQFLKRCVPEMQNQ